MAFEQQDNSGALFKNKRKQQGDRQPEYNGNCVVNGVPMQVAAWFKESKNDSNMKFFSLSFTPPRDGGNGNGGGQSKPAPSSDDGLPF